MPVPAFADSCDCLQPAAQPESSEARGSVATATVPAPPPWQLWLLGVEQLQLVVKSIVTSKAREDTKGGERWTIEDGEL